MLLKQGYWISIYTYLIDTTSTTSVSARQKGNSGSYNK